MPYTAEHIAQARAAWDAERAALRLSDPWWPMAAWSRAPMWQRRPYLLAALHGGVP